VSLNIVLTLIKTMISDAYKQITDFTGIFLYLDYISSKDIFIHNWVMYQMHYYLSVNDSCTCEIVDGLLRRYIYIFFCCAPWLIRFPT